MRCIVNMFSVYVHVFKRVKHAAMRMHAVKVCRRQCVRALSMCMYMHLNFKLYIIGACVNVLIVSVCFIQSSTICLYIGL